MSDTDTAVRLSLLARRDANRHPVVKGLRRIRAAVGTIRHRLARTNLSDNARELAATEIVRIQQHLRDLARELA